MKGLEGLLDDNKLMTTGERIRAFVSMGMNLDQLERLGFADGDSEGANYLREVLSDYEALWHDYLDRLSHEELFIYEMMFNKFAEKGES